MEPSTFRITFCRIKFLSAALCYFLFFFFATFFFAFFFFAIVCYLHMAQKTSLFNNGKTYLQESPTELSKRPINVVITFIVQIIKNPSRKFAMRNFLCLVNSLSHHCAHALMLLLCRGCFNLFLVSSLAVTAGGCIAGMSFNCIISSF
jgi:hypothetical protein